MIRKKPPTCKGKSRLFFTTCFFSFLKKRNCHPHHPFPDKNYPFLYGQKICHVKHSRRTIGHRSLNLRRRTDPLWSGGSVLDLYKTVFAFYYIQRLKNKLPELPTANTSLWRKPEANVLFGNSGSWHLDRLSRSGRSVVPCSQYEIMDKAITNICLWLWLGWIQPFFVCQ